MSPKYSEIINYFKKIIEKYKLVSWKQKNFLCHNTNIHSEMFP